MPVRRLTVRAVLTAFALLMAMAWVPATALAQGGNISITSAGPDGSGNPYDLTVVANDANVGATQLSSMVVHFLQGTNDVYDVTNMQYSSGPATAQVWTPATPIPAASLPAGTYTMTVDAADTTTPESDPSLSAGTIVISYSNTTVTVIPTATTVTEGSQSVTFNGTITGTAQDGLNTQVPIVGATVSVSTDSSAQPVTNAFGQFAYTANGIAANTTFGFSIPAAGDNSYPAGSASVPITAVPATTVISATPSELNVSQGAEQIIFTGSVMAGGAPVPGVMVNVAIGGVSSGQVGPTGSDGSFSYEATGISTTSTFTFSVTGGNLYGPQSFDVQIGTTPSPTSITLNTPSQAFVTQGANTVTMTGTVTVSPPGGGGPVSIGSGIPVNVSVNGVLTTQVTTNTGGGFSYTATGITGTTTYDFNVGATSLYGTQDQAITIPAQAANTFINVIPTQSQIELGSQNVTFNGSVMMTPPGSTTQVNIGGGVPVQVTGASFSTVVTTDSKGDFSLPVTGIASATNFTFSIVQANLYNPTSTQVQINQAQAAQSKIAINTPAIITFGTPSTTITGTVSAVNASSVTVPIAGASVYLNGGTTPMATTDTNGQFSYPTGALTATTNYTFSINADANSLFTAASTPEQVSFAPGSTTMSITMNPTIVSEGPLPVVFTGTVDVTPAGTGTTAGPISAGVQVQVSRNGGLPVLAGATNSSGVFSYSVPDAMPGDEFDFSVAGATLYTPATSDQALSEESTTLTVKPTQPTVTEGSQSVTFNGTATGMVPGGVSEPVTNAPVLLNSQPISGLSTNSTGGFSYTVNSISKSTSYVFSILPDSHNTYTGASQAVSISASQAPTRFVGVKVSPAELRYGQKATLSGTVQYKSSAGIWTNLGGTAVHVAEGKTSIAKATANTAGAFSATLPSTHGFGWSATVDAATLTQQTMEAGNLAISVPLKVRTFSANLGTNGNVSSSGCLQVTAPVKYAPLSTVQIQYATGARGKWRLLGRLPLHNLDRKARGCSGPNESYFSGAIRAANDNAYYRADFAANVSFQGAVSNVIHSWRYATKITSFSVSRHALKQGQIETMTGRLWHKSGRSWKPYGGRTIEIVYNEKGTSFWSNLGTVRTNSKGDFRQTAAGGAGNFVAIIYADYGGNNVDLAARSPGIDVTIRQDGTGMPLTQAATGQPRPLGAVMAPPGLELGMLTRQDQLILGISAASIPIL